MKISINIEHIQKINELKEALIYIYPNKLKDINNAIKDYKGYFDFKNYIVIDDDKIYSTMYCLKQSLFISEYEFINIISILKKCDENTIIVESEYDESLDILTVLYDNKNMTEYISELIENNFCYGFAIIINSDDISAINGRYIDFLKKYNTIDTKTYIRNIKLKKIL